LVLIADSDAIDIIVQGIVPDLEVSDVEGFWKKWESGRIEERGWEANHSSDI
jgi:hypothetical protein